MCTGRVVVASHLAARIYQISGIELVEEKSIALPFEVERLWASSSGRFLVARRSGGRELWCRDLERDVDTLAIVAPNPDKQQLVATVVSALGRDLVVCARDGSELEGFALDDGRLLWRADCETFRFSELVPIDAGAVIAVGFFDGETKDSLLVLDVARAAAASEEIFAQFRTKAGTVDYAYRLRAGPAGHNAFVAFRDPEEDEEDPDPGADALHGFSGVYVRHVSGSLELKIPWKSAPADALVAGPKWIAMQAGDELHLISRESTHEIRTVPGYWLATDCDGARILVEHAGLFEQFEL
jgi:hypothetical protein